MKIKKGLSLVLFITLLVACTDNSMLPSGSAENNGGAIDAAAKVNVARVEFAQVFAQPSTSRYQYIIPNRKVLVRAYIAASDSNVSPAAVTMTASNGSAAQTKIMTCPANFPSSDVATPRYQKSQTCWAEIDDLSLVKTNLTVEIKVGGSKQTLTPKVGDRQVINVTLLPMTVVDSAGKRVSEPVPSATLVANTIKRFAPFATVNVYSHNPIDVPCGTASSYLRAVSQLNSADGGGTHMMGFFHWGCTYPVAGLAWVSGTELVSRSTTDTWLHELGHNLSLDHAPCGTTGDSYYSTNIDGQLPWPNSDEARLDRTPIYDQANDLLTSPGFDSAGKVSARDVMSYCDGANFSEYAYHKIATRISGNNFYTTLPAALELPNQLPNQLPNLGKAIDRLMAYISGRITPNRQVILNPVVSYQGIPASPEVGAYQLSLIGLAGSKADYRFDVQRIDHDDSGDVYFQVVVPAIADLAKIEVRKNGQEFSVADVPVPATVQATVKATSDVVRAASASILAQVTEKNNQVTLNWDHALYPWAGLTYVSAGRERRGIIVQGQGGVVEKSVSDIPARDGHWEISLSRGLQTKVVTQDRSK